ncbi:MAG: flagellar basal body rod protein FlgF [Gammaproteobacteria bacterium]
MDKSLFIGTGGARDTMHRLATITNNLSNSNTIGFREDLDTQKHVPIGHNKKMQSRSYSELDKTYVNLSKGPVITTGRELDIAISGDGFIAVQSKSGREGYTRAGDLQISQGKLTTHSGDLVLGTGGIITIPENASRLHIGSDGTVSAKLKDQAEPVNIARIKLTNPAITDLQKGTDGLLYTISGDDATQNDSIRLINNSLEGSNVNPIEALTKIIDLSRQFEMHGNLIKTLTENAGKANQLLAMK